MPRKSAVAIAALDPRGHRLEPPPGLSAAEREAFVATVRSVRPGHFTAEEMPLLVTYAASIVQERAIARDLEEAGTETAKERLRAAHGRVASSLVRLARALRLGPMARNPSRNRRGVGALPEPSGAPPWEYRPGDKPN
jgi:hypothetical protein